MKEIKIGNKVISEESECLVIAEVGANHNRDINIAKRMIDIAADAGADIVKFQTHSAKTHLSRKCPEVSSLSGQNIYKLIESIELPREWQKELKIYAENRDIMFMSTPFDFQAIDELDELNVPAFKIASFEIVDLELIKYAAQKGRTMIISTGMADLGDIEDAIKVIQEQGNDQIILLHCNSLYPTPPEIVNLKAIDTLKKAFNCHVGFSDHTTGITVPIGAVVMGAKIIEKHFTLDRKMKGPDHKFALEPNEFKNMVKQIRLIESAKGNGIKRRSEEEEENFIKGRRSIVAKEFIPKGTIITKDMICIKRPGYGIMPKFIDIVIGRKAALDIEEDDIITWDMI